MAAFEKSLGNMTGRLQSLTMTAEQKVCPGIATGAYNKTSSCIGCLNLLPEMLLLRKILQNIHPVINWSNDKVKPFHIFT